MTGTSFAAPLVSGVAGLLFSFDTSLTASAVRSLILEGANDGKRVAFDYTGASVPFLDAYSALKAAARQPGARLCGNHVFSTPNGDVFAERANGVSQKLFNSTDGQPYTELLNVLHGGKRIQIGDYLEFKWKSKTDVLWEASTLDGNYHEDAGGTFLSWYDVSDHDATAYLVSNSVVSVGSVVITPLLIRTGGDPITGVLPQIVRPIRELNATRVCASGAPYSEVKSNCIEGEDTGRTFVGSWILPSGYPYALAPQGNFILQTITYRYLSNFVQANYGPEGSLQSSVPPKDTTESLELWIADTSSAVSAARQLKVTNAGGFTRPGMTAEWIAISEEGTEFVWQIGKYVNDQGTGERNCTQRAVEYRALPGHPTVAEGVLTRAPIPVPDSDGCQSFGAATISPTRMGTGLQPQLMKPVLSRTTLRRGAPR